MKVLLTATSLLPAYGGPAHSVSQLAVALTEKGVEVGLWAADGSSLVSELLPPRSLVRRLAGTEQTAILKFGVPDIIHDNGIWLPHNHQLAKLAKKMAIPRVVSARGMLEPWALRHKRLRKQIAWRLYQRRDIKMANVIHATAQAEAANLRALELGVAVCVVPNGVDVPLPAEANSRNLQNEKRAMTALFLGRINPVKGLPMLVQAWARVRPVGWHLTIVGPDEAGHQVEVQRMISAAGLGDIVSFAGPLGGRAKANAYFDADLFVLPTHSESFGMAIAEALAHGLPVLTTKGAPWPMLAEWGCGWWVDPTIEGISSGLRAATALDRAALREIGANGRKLVSTEFGWRKVAKSLVTIYENLIADRPSVDLHHSG